MYAWACYFHWSPAFHLSWRELLFETLLCNAPDTWLSVQDGGVWYSAKVAERDPSVDVGQEQGLCPQGFSIKRTLLAVENLEKVKELQSGTLPSGKDFGCHGRWDWWFCSYRHNDDTVNFVYPSGKMEWQNIFVCLFPPQNGSFIDAIHWACNSTTSPNTIRDIIDW